MLHNFRKIIPLSVLVYVFLLFLSGLSIAAEHNDAPHIMRRGGFRVQAGMEVGDLVILRGPVEIKGIVHGSVMVFDGKVTVFNNAVVSGNITVLDDDLNLLAGSEVHGSVFVIGGKLNKADNAKVSGKISEQSEELGHKSKHLLRKYLIFERPVPVGNNPEQALNRLSQKFRGWENTMIGPWRGPAVGNLPLIPLPEKVAENARIGLWHTGRWEISVGVAGFYNADEAEKFWNEIRKQWPEKNTSRSVHVSLAEGMHWIFNVENRAVAVWMIENNLVMVEVGLIPGRRESPDDIQRMRDFVLRMIVNAWKPKNEK